MYISEQHWIQLMLHMASAIVTPNSTKALALSPEFICGTDGNNKQDSEHKAAKRWLTRMADRLSPLGVTIASEDALHVNWAEVTINKEEGSQKYHNCFITNHVLSLENIEDFIDTARARWKIENETNNTLKTKGYHLEHNFGHGSLHLSEILACLNILAFLFHTILHFSDNRYKLIRKTLTRRDRFFNDVQALTTYFCFQSWTHLLKMMLEGLKLKDPG